MEGRGELGKEGKGEWGREGEKGEVGGIAPILVVGS